MCGFYPSPKAPETVGVRLAASSLSGLTEALLTPFERVQTLLQIPRYNTRFTNFFDACHQLGLRESFTGFSSPFDPLLYSQRCSSPQLHREWPVFVFPRSLQTSSPSALLPRWQLISFVCLFVCLLACLLACLFVCLLACLLAVFLLNLFGNLHPRCAISRVEPCWERA